MIIYMSQVKRKIILLLLILLPIGLGLSNNYLILFDEPLSIVVHLILLAIPVVQIIGALSSFFLFRGYKRVFTYVYCIALIIYTEIVVFFGILSVSERFALISVPTILLYLFYLYGFYPCLLGVLRAFDKFRYRLRMILQRINIHLVPEKLEQQIESEKVAGQSQIHHVYDLRKEFDDFNKELHEARSQVGKQTEKMALKLKSFENGALTFSDCLTGNSGVSGISCSDASGCAA